MNSLLLAPMNLEDLMTASSHVSSHAFDHSMTPPGASIIARIEWCQRRQAQMDAELEEWCAEEEGLRDALLSDRTCQYKYSPPRILARYVLGLEDGRALVRAAWVESIWQPAI